MKYKHDRKGFAKMANGPEVQDICVRAAGVGETWARRLPVEGPPEKLPEYRSGFRVEPAKVQVGSEVRAGALLINDSDVERIFGARNHVLYRAVAQIEGAFIR
ncbi:hypothetical protein [Brevibacterium sp.]|uniref:hypothetical protein n=1 Tax=Brevibacterium sp. TaxID=1701 RepID=UPI002810CD34|nr:hypothetical protein [Brevibacterium sp.]